MGDKPPRLGPLNERRHLSILEFLCLSLLQVEREKERVRESGEIPFMFEQMREAHEEGEGTEQFTPKARDREMGIVTEREGVM